MVGGVTPGLVALGSLRKQAEQAARSKPVSSIPMTSASAPACISSYPAIVPAPVALDDELL